jgi:hypothetical protein
VRLVNLIRLTMASVTVSINQESVTRGRRLDRWARLHHFKNSKLRLGMQNLVPSARVSKKFHASRI